MSREVDKTAAPGWRGRLSICTSTSDKCSSPPSICKKYWSISISSSASATRWRLIERPEREREREMPDGLQVTCAWSTGELRRKEWLRSRSRSRLHAAPGQRLQTDCIWLHTLQAVCICICRNTLCCICFCIGLYTLLPNWLENTNTVTTWKTLEVGAPNGPRM